jgi:hypothetical protein
MLRKIGAAALLVGGLATLVGAVWGSLPHPDANIGAGLLIVLGLPVAGVGLVLLVIGFVLGRRARP